MKKTGLPPGRAAFQPYLGAALRPPYRVFPHDTQFGVTAGLTMNDLDRVLQEIWSKKLKSSGCWNPNVEKAKFQAATVNLTDNGLKPVSA
ncbi:MAG: hypothetical protein AAFN42_05905 [Cyanobacteria bacterium J06554_1]